MNTTNEFTKKDLDNKIDILKVRLPTSYNGKTPSNSLSADLQTIRDKGAIQFLGNGNYKLII